MASPPFCCTVANAGYQAATLFMFPYDGHLVGCFLGSDRRP